MRSRVNNGIIGVTAPATSSSQVSAGIYSVDDHVTAKRSGNWPAQLPPGTPITYVVIGGGGSGGQHNGSGAGGGGGGYRSNVVGENTGGGVSAEAATSLYLNTYYTITVGAGGAVVPSYSDRVGNNGSPSVFGPITAAGGGAGANYTSKGATGGCGGGSGWGYTGGVGTTGQGRDGGYQTADTYATCAAGGGGSSLVGGNASGNGGADGPGGNGTTTSISGTPGTYAGGGGGGRYSGTITNNAGTGGGGSGQNGPGASGSTNTGGGGGGGGNYSPSGGGGSGLVQFKVLNNIPVTFTPGVTYTVSSMGAYNFYRVTAAGPTDTFKLG